VLHAFTRAGDQTDGLMTVIRSDDRWDKRNVLFQDGRLLCYDKKAPIPAMKHIEYGVALLLRPMIEGVAPDRPADLADLYHALVATGRMMGFPVTQRFYEIGTRSGLEETRACLARTAWDHATTGTPPARSSGRASTRPSDYPPPT
jgi:hypothetical protein